MELHRLQGLAEHAALTYADRVERSLAAAELLRDHAAAIVREKARVVSYLQQPFAGEFVEVRFGAR